MTNWELIFKLFGFWVLITVITNSIKIFTANNSGFFSTSLNVIVSILGSFITTALYYAILIELVIYLLTEVA